MASLYLFPRSLINTDDHQAVVDLRLKDGKGSILKIFIGARVQGWSGGAFPISTRGDSRHREAAFGHVMDTF